MKLLRRIKHYYCQVVILSWNEHRRGVGGVADFGKSMKIKVLQFGGNKSSRVWSGWESGQMMGNFWYIAMGSGGGGMDWNRVWVAGILVI